MKGKNCILIFILLIFINNSWIGKAQESLEITVQANKPGAEIQPTMWGVFFEDINFAADGGIYAELVKNRSFEFSLPTTGWRLLSQQNGTGRMVPNFYSPSRPSNPHFMRVYIDREVGAYGFINEGFRGMGIRKDELYNFSVSARLSGNSDMKMTVEIITTEGESIGKAELTGFSGVWKKHHVSLKASETVLKAQLRIILSGNGSIDLDMISMFPADTWRGRPNGLRKDIVEMIAALKPGFVRFPGGCIVEGRDLTNRYQWKTTVGPVDDRKVIMNRWNVEIRNRQAPDYFQSFGLGFYEYFLLAEDIGAEPLPILNCGMSCQFNAAEVVPMEELDQYIQDALDLIEFANGETTTKWGMLRAEMGHPEKFNLKFIGVGNEQWDEQYIDRYKIFEKALKSKHPEIKIVSGSGPSSSGRYFDYAWSELKKLSPDLIWFDNLTTIGTPNYYVQKAFSNYKGTRIVPALSAGKPLTGQDGLYASSTIDMQSGKLYIKIVNSTDSTKPVTLALGTLPFEKNAIKETLRSDSPDKFNAIADPRIVYPAKTLVKVAGKKIISEAEPLSVNVFIIDFKIR